MVVEKASGRDSPLRQGAGKSFWTLPISGRRWRWLTMCFWKIDQVFRFFLSRGIYRRKGGVRRWTSWSHPWWRGQGLGHATLGCGQALAPLRLIFGLRDASGKTGGSAFVSSNSENISCVAFLKHKNSRNRELALWHLVNRLF
jgi:hypothetical protein